ncbi:MAG: hypothetical protein ACRD1Y_04310 [Terriglobales bacterium]
MPRRDELAPPFAVPDQDGQAQTIASLSGERGLVLLFYRGYW